MYSEPLGYFITITVRGSWLRGDERGSVKKGTGFLPPDPNWVRMDASNLANPPLLFSDEQRIIIEQAIRTLCDERGWILHEINVRTNHAHFVVTAFETPPEKVMLDFKAKGTRALRKAGLFPQDQRPWTEHGSTIYLFKQNEFDSACIYVRDGQ